MQKGIFALLGTHNANTINTIKSFTSTFQMPYITPSMPFNTSGQETGFEIYMQPLYSRALISYMTERNWQKAYYVYIDQDGKSTFISHSKQSLATGFRLLYLFSYNVAKFEYLH